MVSVVHICQVNHAWFYRLSFASCYGDTCDKGAAESSKNQSNESLCGPTTSLLLWGFKPKENRLTVN